MYVAALIGAPVRSVFLLGTGTTAMVLFAVVLAGIGLLPTVRLIVSMDSFVLSLTMPAVAPADQIGYLYNAIMVPYGDTLNSPNTFGPWKIPLLGDIPIIGPVFFDSTVFLYITWYSP